MATPHIDAEPGDFAPAVLMPGDPRRAKLIAETLFESPRLVNEVRGILGYTGTFDGRPISVLASGMGCPSITIYATELYRFFGVRRIIRVGTAGGMQEALQLGDVIAASAAHTDSAMASARIPGVSMSHAPTFELLASAVGAARAANCPCESDRSSPPTISTRPVRRRPRRSSPTAPWPSRWNPLRCTRPRQPRAAKH